MKKNILLIISILYLVSYSSIYSKVIKVPTDKSSIQIAINYSQNGDTVIVLPGVYYENIDFRGKKIFLGSQFVFTNNPNDVFNTIIDGSRPSTDTASCVLFHSGEDANSILMGLTLRGGSGTIWRDSHTGELFREGGGILIDKSSPRISSNYITKCVAVDYDGLNSAGGGAIRYADSDCNPIIENNIIKDCKGLYGSAIVAYWARGIIRNNLIVDNSGSTSYGGGTIWCARGNITIIENNTIINNQSFTTGGGIDIAQKNVVIRNNIIYGNTGNTSDVKLSQIHFRTNGTATVSYSIVQGGYEGTGNMNSTPLFESGKYILTNNSPGVDGGNPDLIYNDLKDPSSNNAKYPSKGSLRNDMGAYGGQSPLILIEIATGIGVNDKPTAIPNQFWLDQNYPNPFNPSTVISYQLPVGSFVTIKVYGVLGKEVATLVNKYQQPGRYVETFNGTSLPSGVYIFSLKANGFIQSKKMVLLK